MIKMPNAKLQMSTQSRSSAMGVDQWQNPNIKTCHYNLGI
jgi:hypothetical protein